MRAPILGRGLLTVIAALLLFDGLFQIASPPMAVQALTHIGFEADVGPMLAMVTLSCAIMLAIPMTAPLGAVLTTGFLGGAICAHFRIGEIGSLPQLICLGLGIMTWMGLMLADRRIQPLIDKPGS